MPDFRPHMPLALEEFVDKILMESFSLRKKPLTHTLNLDTHTHPPTDKFLFRFYWKDRTKMSFWDYPSLWQCSLLGSQEIAVWDAQWSS